jgi:hypothetical protein
MEDLHALAEPYQGVLNIVALDKNGRHAAFSNREKRTYVYMTEEMDEPEELPRIVVP